MSGPTDTTETERLWEPLSCEDRGTSRLKETAWAARIEDEVRACYKRQIKGIGISDGCATHFALVAIEGRLLSLARAYGIDAAALSLADLANEVLSFAYRAAPEKRSEPNIPGRPPWAAGQPKLERPEITAVPVPPAGDEPAYSFMRKQVSKEQLRERFSDDIPVTQEEDEAWLQKEVNDRMKRREKEADRTKRMRTDFSATPKQQAAYDAEAEKAERADEKMRRLFVPDLGQVGSTKGRLGTFMDAATVDGMHRTIESQAKTIERLSKALEAAHKAAHDYLVAKLTPEGGRLPSPIVGPSDC